MGCIQLSILDQNYTPLKVVQDEVPKLRISHRSKLPKNKDDAGLYRFGFNGKEMDNEVSGSGNQYDYGFRIYNPRLGKFLSVDPLTASYPWYTPYQFAGNKPIWAVDIDGLEEGFLDINYGQMTITTTRDATLFEQVNSGLIAGAPLVAARNLLAKKAARENGDQSYVRTVYKTDVLTNQDGEAFTRTYLKNEVVPMGNKFETATDVLDLGTGGNGKAAGLLTKVPKAAGRVADEVGDAVTKGKAWMVNIIKGQQFEEAYFKVLKGGVKEGEKLVRRVSFVDEDGVRAVVDFVKQNVDGSFELIETKLRKSTSLTKNQKKVYKAIKDGTATPVGDNAKEAGLKVGEKFKGTVTRKNKHNN